MGKGGSNEVKETEAQKALAEVAQNQWNLYKGDLQQYEDLFMDKVEDLNSEEVQEKQAGIAAIGTAQSFGHARSGLADAMASSGVDPTSGKYQETMTELETDQALSQTDTTNRAQSSQQDKYVAGLKDVASMGQGQKAEALSGYSSLASTSLHKAASDAQNKFNEKQATLGLVGAVGGAATAYGMNSMKPAGDKKISPTASVLQGKGY
ncbi:hypothetical protein ACKC5O_00375 [Aeromonas schubertii]|uniref:hypothetical protein n=1 Tax=Aeromonas schubertii TaxID=652 RepID=UPI0038B649A6